MSFTEALILVIRWIHAIAAVAWVGGGLFYLLVLRPNLSKGDGASANRRRIGEQFRGLVNTAIAVLLVTGVIMTLSRLTSNVVGPAYIAVLVVKVVLALYMFYLVRFLRSKSYPQDPEGEAHGLRRITSALSGATAVTVLGVAVFMLADVLRALVEISLDA